MSTRVFLLPLRLCRCRIGLQAIGCIWDIGRRGFMWLFRLTDTLKLPPGKQLEGLPVGLGDFA